MRRAQPHRLQLLHKGPCREIRTFHRRQITAAHDMENADQLRRAQLTFFASEVVGPRTLPGTEKSVAEDDKGTPLALIYGQVTY